MKDHCGWSESKRNKRGMEKETAILGLVFVIAGVLETYYSSTTSQTRSVETQRINYEINSGWLNLEEVSFQIGLMTATHA